MSDFFNPSNSRLAELLAQATKRKVFISFHHGGDYFWFGEFKKVFSAQYEVFHDHSVGEAIRSKDAEYVNRRIREDFIRGSSITIVLCGAETWKRKYVDWEIYSTLYVKHALLGMLLPTVSRNAQNAAIIPDRLAANIHTGYATYMNWTDDPAVLKSEIERALLASNDNSKIDNAAQKMGRNKS